MSWLHWLAARQDFWSWRIRVWPGGGGVVNTWRGWRIVKIVIPYVSNLPVLLCRSCIARWVVPCGKWRSAELYVRGGGYVSKVVERGLFDIKVHFVPILSCPHTTSVCLNLLLGEWYTTVMSKRELLIHGTKQAPYIHKGSQPQQMHSQMQ